MAEKRQEVPSELKFELNENVLVAQLRPDVTATVVIARQDLPHIRIGVTTRAQPSH